MAFHAVYGFYRIIKKLIDQYSVNNISSIAYNELCELVAIKLPENKYAFDDVLQELQKDGFLVAMNNIVTVLH